MENQQNHFDQYLVPCNHPKNYEKKYSTGHYPLPEKHKKARDSLKKVIILNIAMSHGTVQINIENI